MAEINELATMCKCSNTIRAIRTTSSRERKRVFNAT